MPHLQAAAAPPGLFVDAAFPAGLPASVEHSGWTVSWKRPHELSDDPQLLVDGAARTDVQQGSVGDCWFLSACIAIAQHRSLLGRIMPLGQVLSGEGYTGRLTFSFWHLGEWESVEIDDRLPVNELDQILFGRCAHPDEFWLPLLEKAFAKFQGGYDRLGKGSQEEGVLSLTGFTVQHLDLGELGDGELFDVLRTELRRGALLTCSTSKNGEGLQARHSYTLSGAAEVELGGGRKGKGLVRLLRLNDPWGDVEWTGKWADGDKRWTLVPKAMKERMGAAASNPADGEFWMDDVDFTARFGAITLATPTPLEDDEENLVDGPSEHMSMVQGEWEVGVNAGGCEANWNKYATNPQFSLILKAADSGKEPKRRWRHKTFCSVTLELVQDVDRRRHPDLDSIAVAVYAALSEGERLPASELRSTPQEGSVGVAGTSAAVLQMELPAGAYVVVVNTFEPNCPRRFLLRARSPQPFTLAPLPPA